MQALKAKAAAQQNADAVADRTTMTEVSSDAEMTYTANGTTSNSGHAVKTGMGLKKKPGKPKLSAKEKKERSVCALALYCRLIEPVVRLAFD
jgi:DASH complex subunit DAM1